jgi:hypothetical protein
MSSQLNPRTGDACGLAVGEGDGCTVFGDGDAVGRF